MDEGTLPGYKFEVEVDGEPLENLRQVRLPPTTIEIEENDDITPVGIDTDRLELTKQLEHDDTKFPDWRALVMEDDSEMRKNITVVIKDENGKPATQYEFIDAWPTVYDPPDLDSSSDGDVATESVTIVFDEMKRGL